MPRFADDPLTRFSGFGKILALGVPINFMRSALLLATGHNYSVVSLQHANAQSFASKVFMSRLYNRSENREEKNFLSSRTPSDFATG